MKNEEFQQVEFRFGKIRGVSLSSLFKSDAGDRFLRADFHLSQIHPLKSDIFGEFEKMLMFYEGKSKKNMDFRKRFTQICVRLSQTFT